MHININRNNLLDIINIKFDVFNPINSFMSKQNIVSVIDPPATTVREEFLALPQSASAGAAFPIITKIIMKSLPNKIIFAHF